MMAYMLSADKSAAPARTLHRQTLAFGLQQEQFIDTNVQDNAGTEQFRKTVFDGDHVQK